jgi:hypothetical protein
MLGVKTYTKQYIDDCRAKIEADLAAYRALAATSNGPALVKFETRYFNCMVLVLEMMFVHRLRMVEGKDGNALNEVRVLADSILANGGVMGTDKTIKLVPAKSVLKYEVGDPIQLTEEAFVRLFRAFFAELDAKFV